MAPASPMVIEVKSNFFIGLAHRLHSHGLDRIAHVTRWVPERLDGLGLANAVGGLYFELVLHRPDWVERKGPLAKGVFAQILAQFSLAPLPAAILGEEDFCN